MGDGAIMRITICNIYIILIVLFSFNPIYSNIQAQNKFEIIGKTQGFQDSTILYLYDNENQLDIDSTFIMNNSFILKGTFLEPNNYYIKTKYNWDSKSFEYKYLWIDNSRIYLEGRSGDFNNAKISGSIIQAQVDELTQLTNNKPYSEQPVIEQEYIKRHPHYLYSAYLISVYASKYGREKTEELFNLLDPKLKISSYGKTIQTYITLNHKFEVGAKEVEIQLNDLKGESKCLSALKGKIVLLEFWSSSCGPCRFDNPKLKKTYIKYKNKGFEIFAVTLDKNKKQWQTAVEIDSINWITVSDLKGFNSETALTYGIYYIPTNYLINKDGIILAKDIRGKELNNKLEEIFNTVN
jgi:thiol-disulfide isomerase/thioredoxin